MLRSCPGAAHLYASVSTPCSSHWQSRKTERVVVLAATVMQPAADCATAAQGTGPAAPAHLPRHKEGLWAQQGGAAGRQQGFQGRHQAGARSSSGGGGAGLHRQCWQQGAWLPGGALLLCFDRGGGHVLTGRASRGREASRSPAERWHVQAPAMHARTAAA